MQQSLHRNTEITINTITPSYAILLALQISPLLEEASISRQCVCVCVSIMCPSLFWLVALAGLKSINSNYTSSGLSLSLSLSLLPPSTPPSSCFVLHHVTLRSTGWRGCSGQPNLDATVCVFKCLITEHNMTVRRLSRVWRFVAWLHGILNEFLHCRRWQHILFLRYANFSWSWNKYHLLYCIAILYVHVCVFMLIFRCTLIAHYWGCRGRVGRVIPCKAVWF